jgi:hypothetical protein
MDQNNLADRENYMPDIHIDNMMLSQYQNTILNLKDKPLEIEEIVIESDIRKIKIEKIKQLLRDTFHTSNEMAKGLLKVCVTSHLTIKIFWIVCLIAATAMNSYLIIEAFTVYFSFGVSTTARTVFETPALFPKVTFCNKNLFTTKYAYDLLEGSGYNEIVYEMNYVLNASQRSMLRHSFDDVLISCLFNDQPCSSTDFYKEYDKNLGNCYVFNYGMNINGQKIPLKESIRAGATFGLSLELYLNFYENLTEFNKVIGAYIRIGNSSFLDVNDGVNISPGFETNVAVERHFEFNLPKPYSNCDVDNNEQNVNFSDLYKLIYFSAYEYTQQLCFDLCFQKQVGLQCNCSKYNNYQFFTSYEPCKLSQAKCVDNLTKAYLTDGYIEKNCVPYCPIGM